MRQGYRRRVTTASRPAGSSARRPTTRGPGRLLDRYGPWAVVTGASSGLGLAAAEQLAALGFGVALVARREDRLRDLEARLVHAGPGAVRVIVADLGAAAGATQVLDATADLDVGLLVHSAGWGTSGPFTEADIAHELAMLDANCASTVRLCHAYGRRFVDRGRGGLVLFGSLVGGQGTPWSAHYAATKAYVQTLGEGLGHELHPRGVDVLVALPGPVDTGFADVAGMHMSRTDKPGPVVHDVFRALGRRPTVVPGTNGRFLGRALAALPRRARTRVMARAMRRMLPSAQTRG